MNSVAVPFAEFDRTCSLKCSMLQYFSPHLPYLCAAQLPLMLLGVTKQKLTNTPRTPNVRHAMA